VTGLGKCPHSRASKGGLGVSSTFCRFCNLVLLEKGEIISQKNQYFPLAYWHSEEIHHHSHPQEELLQERKDNWAELTLL
jgi:hypothetical protein